MTYSIVAHDPDENAWGVAVASKFLAAGAVVSWARGGVGAVATQALARVSYGRQGLKLMEQGKTAQETIDLLIQADEGRDHRQVGLVDPHGNAAAYTGKDCHDWAGHLVGDGFTCQGNILTGGDTLEAMAQAFTSAKGELADRLVEALLAGDTIGGDRRGKQSAAVMVVIPNGGYGGDNDNYLDLRVDDHSDPVNRLKELVGIHHLFFGQQNPDDLMPITSDIAREIQALLAGQYYEGAIDGQWGEQSVQAFWAMVGNENLEERWNLDGDINRIDSVVLDYVRSRFG